MPLDVDLVGEGHVHEDRVQDDQPEELDAVPQEEHQLVTHVERHARAVGRPGQLVDVQIARWDLHGRRCRCGRRVVAARAAMAVAVAASAAFLTPIGHKNNTLVLGPGGYRFGDYWRMGLPLEIIVVAVSIPAILVFWPL